VTSSDLGLTARSAFAGSLVPTAGTGLVAAEREYSSIASLSVRRGQRAALQGRVAAHLGFALPEGARRVASGAIAAAGTGPGSWLLTCDDAGRPFIPDLKSAVGEAGSVADQSDAYAILHLSGPKLREALATLLPLDLHPRVFKVGDVAATLAAHISAIVWRIEDDADGQPGIELAVPRSMAASVWHLMRPA
jgi:sarcosine oxidase subunit gamma